MTSPLRPSQRRSRLFYFLFFGAMASLVPFLVVFYERLGLEGRQVGVLTALLPVATLAVGPLWGALADTLGRHRAVAVLAIAGAATSGALVSLGTNFATLLPLVAALAVFLCPIVPLTDTVVLAGLGVERERYGRIRLWGAVGFGAASLVAGSAVDRIGLTWSFAAFATLLALALIVGAGLPWRAVAQDRDAEAPGSDSGDVAGPSRRLQRASFRDFVSVRWIALLIAGLLGGAALVPCTTFLYLYLAERGAPTATIGIALALATASEIPTMLLASRWLSRVRPRYLLLGALGVFAVRAGLYGALDTTPALVAVQLLHGPSFALLLVAGVGRADKLAIPGRRATGQSLYTASVMGYGAAIGSLGGGALYSAVGPRVMYGIVAAAVGVAAALLASWRVDDA